MPYGFLYYHLPGFDSMRVPARFSILYLLSVAALAGLGLTWLLGAAGRNSRAAARHCALARTGRSRSLLIAAERRRVAEPALHDPRDRDAGPRSRRSIAGWRRSPTPS